LLAQYCQTLSQGDRRDAELGGQLGLRRSLLAVADESQVDRPSQPINNGVHAAGPVEWREHPLARVTGLGKHRRPLLRLTALQVT
jgi:hypothetical protein